MKIKSAVCIAMAFALTASSLAFGQGRGNRDRDRDGVPDRLERDRRGDADRDRRGDRNRFDNGERRHGPPSWANNRHDRFPDGNRRWNRGERLPPEYRDRQYVVQDWRGHRLSAPPRGHQWVQNGSDYLLVAIATGVIAQLLMNR
jgi:Ni/Co efflux regulator RcnB